MAEKTEFLQAIDDAILDADSLERFINGSDSETVLTRLSAEYPTLQKAIKELFENGGLPATPFANKAEMEASELVDGMYAMVTDDAANNGLYVKSGGSWSLSQYAPTADAIGFATDIFNSIYANKGRNLLDISSLIGGGYLNPAGVFTSNAGYSISEYILVKPNTVYSASSGEELFGIQDISFFDSKKNFIKRITLPNTGLLTPPKTEFTTPSNASYLVTNISNGRVINNLMINEGEFTEYVPYSKPVIKDIVLSDEDTQALAEKIAPNNFDAEHVLPQVNLLNPDDFIKGGYINGSDVFVSSAGYLVSGFIEVDSADNYVISHEVMGSRLVQSINTYDADKLLLKTIATPIEAVGWLKLKFDDGTKYVRINCLHGEADDYERMFYKGSEQIPYTPFRYVTLKNVDVDYKTANNIKKKLGVVDSGDSRLGDELAFTGDRHPAVLLDFPDSYTVNDPRTIHGHQPVTYSELVGWWQDLVDEFPDYITKKKIGTDSSGTYDVHSYTFMPKKGRELSSGAKPSKEYPRVLLVVQHIEHLNQIYPLLAMREMCRKWKSDPVLASLRLECEFVVIPYHHPYGLGGKNYRLTSEGLNTNGDWPYNWSHVENPLNGDAPFATQEARNVKAVVESFKPHVIMDLHSNSYKDYQQGIWIDAEANPRYEASVREAVLSLYPKIVSKWEDTPDINTFFTVTRSNADRQLPGYAYAVGATGGLMEFVKDYKGRPGLDGIYNDTLILSSSLMLNIIVQCIAEYRDYGRPNKGTLYSGSGVYKPDA